MRLLLPKLCTGLLLILLSSCSKAPEVEVAEVSLGTIQATVNSVNSGVVRAEQISELAFGAVGRVKKLNVKLGDIVEKDFVIAEIENQDTIVALETASRELKRQETLSKTGASSPSILEQSETQLKVAEEAYQKTLIKAPFKGVVAELNMEVGQLSQITTELKKALIRIVDLSPRYVRAEIDEVDLPHVKIGQSSSVKILAQRTEPFKAQVRKVVPFINSVREQDRTAEIELTIESDQILTAGASADVEIVTDQKDQVLLLPLRAISSSDITKYVYKLENGRAKKTAITIGLSNYESAEVISGLEKGDLVVLPNEDNELSDDLKVSIKVKN
jgi:HlyD family secretion protein